MNDDHELPKLAARVSQALALLCDEAPPMDLVQLWLDYDESFVETGADNLQDWAATHSRLNWFMGITVIEAAILLAEEPDENLISRIESDEERSNHKLPHGWWKE